MTKINNIFIVGNMKDAEDAVAQKEIGVFAVLKCTNARFADGLGEKKFPFHKEYLNVAIADDGSCPDEGLKQAKSWLSAIEMMAKARKATALIHSDTGTGKATRLVVAQTSNWSASKYDKAMKKMSKETKPMPGLDAALKGMMKK